MHVSAFLGTKEMKLESLDGITHYFQSDCAEEKNSICGPKDPTVIDRRLQTYRSDLWKGVDKVCSENFSDGLCPFDKTA